MRGAIKHARNCPVRKGLFEVMGEIFVVVSFCSMFVFGGHETTFICAYD